MDLILMIKLRILNLLKYFTYYCINTFKKNKIKIYFFINIKSDILIEMYTYLQ